MGRKTGRVRYKSLSPQITPWSTADVWVTLKAMIVDLLEADENDVHEGETFERDLYYD